MASLFAWLYAPGFFLLFNGLAISLLHGRPQAAWLLVPLLLLAILLSLLAERWRPYEKQWNRDHGDSRRDVTHAFVNESLNLFSIAAIPLVAALLPHFSAWPLHWPFFLQWLLAVVVADLGITLMHWFSHRSAWLWRLHAVHHSVQRMYGLNGLMKHPLHQAAEALAGTVPLLLLGMPVSVAAGLAFAIAIQLLLQHSNVDMRVGPLRKVFAWAPLHRFHHLKYGRAGDVNFGLFFTLWDRLLGTAFDSRYRVAGGDLGIGSEPDYPKGWRAQMLAPFRQRQRHPVPVLPQGLRTEN
ncbi:MAG TPA: sterol desaturase family protein [Moraxellaceae bacterium]